ncbi:MAG: 5-formyltetrahydrofolate cyclo-ligase [Candidatus Aureabacteria bacterium]|nr:5-formyltetrahydrofolate cyclo-ligase [Candidatus Auribacterota bacterium]
MEKNKSKKQFRQDIKNKLFCLDNKEVVETGSIIMKKILDLKRFQKAKKVFTYIATKGEPNTLFLLKEILNKKEVYVPRCLDNDNITAIRIRSFKDLSKGKYGIAEPKPDLTELFHCDSESIILVPGIVFDEKGHRIGRGKGCYDRYLARQKKKCPVWGICFDFQILKLIPFDSWDIKMTGLITEKRTLLEIV